MKEETIRALMIAPGNRPVLILLKNDLTSLQQAVSIGYSQKGYIEILNLEPGICLICNEFAIAETILSIVLLNK